MTEYSNRPRVVATYQSGDIGRLTNIERFATAYQAVENHLTNNAERLQLPKNEIKHDLKLWQRKREVSRGG